SERKTIEAKGIREFQDIVKDGITDRYLMWKGIDATLQLAQSPNSKVIVIGSGPNGLPILLGNLDGTLKQAPPDQPGTKTGTTATTPSTDSSMALTPSSAVPPGPTAPGDNSIVKETPAVTSPTAGKPNPNGREATGDNDEAAGNVGGGNAGNGHAPPASPPGARPGGR
ncbi:MAG TPA: hypothetical protein VKT70_07950, partial [Stellaceae bacterium]|nr:hypothetical protein [Stellaceae bacterium]